MKKILLSLSVLTLCLLSLVSCDFHVHDFQMTLQVPATCTEVSFTQYTCSCGAVRSEYGEAPAPHNYVNGVCTMCGDRNTVKVTFVDVHGNKVSEKETTSGGTVTAPAVPVRTGYTGEWEEFTVGETDLTVHPVYTAISYSITVHENGGAVASGIPGTYTVESEITLPAATKGDEVFTGWYLDEALTKRVMKVERGTTGDLDLYAGFEKGAFTITYEVNGGTLPANAPISYRTTETISLPSPTRENYTFGGWYTDAALTKAAGSQIIEGTKGDKTYYAKWTPRTFTISYNLNGGINSGKNPSTYTPEDEVTLSAPSKTGATFKGWYTDAAFTTSVTSIPKGSAGNKTLYAKFECSGAHSWGTATKTDDGLLYTCKKCPATKVLAAVLKYSDFGAKGDGVTDDSAAIRQTHETANSYGYPVMADADATYYIGRLTAPIIIKTSTDWNGATFIIDDTTIDPKVSSQRAVEIFEIRPDVAEKTLTVPSGMKLKAGQANIGMTFSDSCLLIIENANKKDFLRYGENHSAGDARHEIIIVDKNGNVDPSTPIQYNYDQVTSIKQYSLNETAITLENGNFITKANDPTKYYKDYQNEYYYFTRGIRCYRSNTTFKNIDHVVEGEKYTSDRLTSFGAPYAGFYYAQRCANIVYENIGAFSHHEFGFYQTNVDTGKETYNGMGSYDVATDCVVNVTFDHLIQHNDITDRTNLHGLMGTNYTRNVVMRDSWVDRFDAHKGLCNVEIYDSTLGFNLFICGTGRAYCENVTRLVGDCFLSARPDYGSLFDGDIILKNCTMESSAADSCIYGCVWYKYDFNNPDVMVNNMTIDNFVFTNAPGYVFRFTNATEASLTDATNPLIAPKTLTMKNMTAYPVAKNLAMRGAFRDTVVTKENCTEIAPFFTDYSTGYGTSEHGGTGYDESIEKEGENAFYRIKRNNVTTGAGTYYSNVQAKNLAGDYATADNKYPTSGVIVLDLKVRASSTALLTKFMMVGYRSDGSTKNYDSFLEINSSGALQIGSSVSATSSQKTLVSKLSATEWTRVTVVIHVDTKKVDYYVDGVAKQTGKSMSVTTTAYYSYFHVDGSSSSAANSYVDIDDLGIYYALPEDIG